MLCTITIQNLLRHSTHRLPDVCRASQLLYLWKNQYHSESEKRPAIKLTMSPSHINRLDNLQNIPHNNTTSLINSENNYHARVDLSSSYSGQDQNEEETVLSADIPQFEFSDAFTIGSLIGMGQFARVHKAVRQPDKTTFAVKCLHSSKLTQEGMDALMAELGALSRLSHPNIISHHGFYSDQYHYHLVLDYCERGSLRDMMKKIGKLNEKTCQAIIHQLLSAVSYCHDMKYVHRDIKAENILLHKDTLSSQVSIKLADFGLCRELRSRKETCEDVCGTPQYLSPEIVSGYPYGSPSDIWSSGILLYYMLYGHNPFFYAHSEKELCHLIRAGAIRFDYPTGQRISDEAKDFMSKMLEPCPTTRATANQLLTHSWLSK